MARREIEIRGVTYRSITKAAEALGICRQTVSLALRDDRLQTVGTGHHGQPVRIRGKHYISIRQAAHDLGLSYAAVANALNAGVPDSAGIMPVGFSRAKLQVYDVFAVSLESGQRERLASCLGPTASWVAEAYTASMSPETTARYDMNTFRVNKAP